ncbi:Mcm10 protein [Saccharomycopsis crataegensis]|uniref:Mcm10 protein n=1 Tax=Saccharomycopsis crataegensis TaxID=43959 RepID=A0AAV5QQZ9_9ASCO|nr:Mcm10 protein [Saccharomycopsis crataegensis]
MPFDTGCGIISDEEDDFINQEHKSNKLREISRIDDEVGKRQKEIDQLLAQRQQQKQALISNEKQTELDDQRAIKKQQQQQQQKRIKSASMASSASTKRHILSNNNNNNSFAQKLANVYKSEKATQLERKQFLQERKYAFGLDNDESIMVTPIDVDGEKEEYSGQQLSKRYIDATTISKIFKDKKVLRVDKLFAKVCPPDFSEPEYPNWVVIGVITAKEDPKKISTDHSRQKKTTTSDSGGKYMKLTISNYVLSVSLMLFGPAFDKYWKLQAGDVVGILNPKVSPWKFASDGQYKSFNLVLSTDYDSIVEIGRSKNFGHCKAFKKNSSTRTCGVPVDKSKSEYCEYHQNLSLKRITANRLELGGLSTSGGPNKSRNMVENKTVLMNTNYKTNDARSFGLQIYDNPNASRFHSQDDLNVGNVYFSNINAKKAFFDDEYVNPEAVANVDSKRKKLANKKKESELRQRLSGIKGGKSLKNDIVYDEAGNLEAMKQNAAKVFETAFTPDTINQLGFDPTKKMFGASKLQGDDVSDRRGRAKHKIESLDAIRKKRKRIHLSPSRESKEKRTKDWNRNVKSLKHYRKEVQEKQDFQNYLSEELSSAPSSAFSSPAKVKKQVDVGNIKNQQLDDEKITQQLETGKKNLVGKLMESSKPEEVNLQSTKKTMVGKFMAMRNRPEKQNEERSSSTSSSDSELEIDFGGNEEKYYSAIGSR